MHPNTFKPGWHDNTGNRVINRWEVWLSVADEDEEAGYYLDLIEIEARDNCRLDTIVKKALSIAEMKGWEFTHQEIQVTNHGPLPSGWTRRSGKHE